MKSYSIIRRRKPQSGHSTLSGFTGQPHAGHLPPSLMSFEARNSGFTLIKCSSTSSFAFPASDSDTSNRYGCELQPFLHLSTLITHGTEASIRTLYNSFSNFRSPSLITTGLSRISSLHRFRSSCSFSFSSGRRRTVPQSAQFWMCEKYSVPQSGHIFMFCIVIIMIADLPV